MALLNIGQTLIALADMIPRIADEAAPQLLTLPVVTRLGSLGCLDRIACVISGLSSALHTNKRRYVAGVGVLAFLLSSGMMSRCILGVGRLMLAPREY
jgi:hypothetical protein